MFMYCQLCIWNERTVDFKELNPYFFSHIRKSSDSPIAKQKYKLWDVVYFHEKRREKHNSKLPYSFLGPFNGKHMYFFVLQSMPVGIFLWLLSILLRIFHQSLLWCWVGYLTEPYDADASHLYDLIWLSSIHLDILHYQHIMCQFHVITTINPID